MNLQNVLTRITTSFQQFMAGRNGVDPLSIALMVLSFVLYVIGAVVASPILTLIYFAVSVACIFRMLSKDLEARHKENAWFTSITDRAFTPVRQWFVRMQNRNVYYYLTCPSCHQKLRVPRGRGRITITCAKCGEKIDKTT